MSKDNSLDNSPAAFFTPAHGRGKLRIIRHGEVLNPSGLSGRYQEVRRLAKAASLEAMKTLIVIAMDPTEDTRARIVAIQEILGRAFGKIREMEPEAPLNLSGASVEQLELLLQIVQAAERTEGEAGD